MAVSGESFVQALSALPLQQLLLGIVILSSVAVLVRLQLPRADWYRRLSDRLLFGVPWGTLVVTAGLLAVYYGLQGGYLDPDEPVVLGFRAWSYFDPSGIVLASFSHASHSHLIGNVIGTLVFGSLAEYVWSHHVERQTDSPWRTLWTDPVMRAVGIFPAAVVVVGIVGAAVALGPIIGFSTVVFAFAGFTLIRYPLTTVIASVSTGVISTLLTTLRVPQQVAIAETTYSTPWFASIAVQGHAVGLLLGVVIGLGLLWHREQSPPPVGRLWVGVLLFSMSRSLWAVYWYRGNEVYVLYRAVGIALVFVLVTLVTYATVASNRPLFPSRAVPNPQTIRSGLNSITSREVGLALLLCGAAIVVGPAIGANLTTAAEADLPGDPIEIRGYEVTYGEDVPDGQLSAIDIEAFGETTQLNTSGVIVRNTDRQLWATAVSAGRLANSGEQTVRLGGIGWRETVTVTRTGWSAVGGESTYTVSLSHGDEQRQVFTADPARAEPIVAGTNISIAPVDEEFVILLDEDVAADPVAIPDHNESVTVGEVTFVTQDDRLFAVHNETVVRIAERE